MSMGVSRPHVFPCPHCRKIVGNEDLWQYFCALVGNDKDGYYIDFGGDKRYFSEIKAKKPFRPFGVCRPKDQT